MIFLLLDFLLSFFSNIPTFFVLLNFTLFSKKQFFPFLLIPLVLDLFVVNTYFLNTILFAILFFIIKHLKITKTNFLHFLLLITFVYVVYVLSLGIIEGFSVSYLLKFMFKNYWVNFVFYVLCYKILFPYIKLSR